MDGSWRGRTGRAGAGRGPRGLGLAASAAGCLVVVGCGQFRSHRANLERLHADGRYELAAQILDEARDDLYRRDPLLWRLERGAVALANDDQDATVEHLEVAERMIDTKREARADEVVAKWLLSERSAPYLAEPYEDIYVNVLKLMAQLEAGRIGGYATVEARRLAWKADHLRDVHEAWASALDRRARDRLGRTPHSRWEGSEGEYIESTLGTFLSAVAFMEAGEDQMQAVAGRRLIDSIQRQRGLIGTVEADPFEAIETMAPGRADLLVVALSGRGPTKVADRVGPIVVHTVPIYFELPRLKRHPSEVASASIQIEGRADVQLSLVEDMASVAEENHERYLPLVYTRTLLRAALKATGTAVAAEAARGEDEDWAALVTVLGGLLFMAATERADLRGWTFLPGQARVALAELPEGTHRVRTVYRSAGGSVVHTTPWREVQIEERGLVTLVEHYWR